MERESGKHKFKRQRGFVYMVMSKCEYCGLEREGTKGNYTYLTKIHNGYSGNPRIRHSEIEPPCTKNPDLLTTSKD